MRLLWAVIALGACKHPEPAAPAAPVEQCAGEQWAIAELAALKVGVKQDPATALGRLGVGVDDFEPVARTLYLKWLEKHPEARPKPPEAPKPAIVVAQPPVQAPIQARVPFDTVSWWCFEDPEWGDCSLTKATCDEWRAKIASAGYCERWTGETNAQCIATMVETLHLSECTHQERVSCFGKHHVLRNENDLACAPSIRTCKARRANVLKKLGDDIRVTSDCKPHD